MFSGVTRTVHFLRISEMCIVLQPRLRQTVTVSLGRRPTEHHRCSEDGTVTFGVQVSDEYGPVITLPTCVPVSLSPAKVEGREAATGRCEQCVDGGHAFALVSNAVASQVDDLHAAHVVEPV